MLKELIKLANDLDSKGLTKEADYLDAILKAASLKDNLELLDEAMATLNALRMEMDPDSGSEPGDSEPAPDDPYLTESSWNALEKDFDL